MTRAAARAPASLPALIALLALAAAAPLFAQGAPLKDKPTWYPDHALDYPSAKYVVRVGEGTDAVSARNDAIGQLADYFGVDVNSVSTGTVDYRDATVGGVTQSRLESSISSKIRIASSQKLFNTETTPSYQIGPDRVVMLAFIERESGLVAWDALEETAIARLRTCLARVPKTDIPMSTRLAAYKASRSLLAQIRDIETKRRLIQVSAPALLDPALVASSDSLADTFPALSAISVEVSGDDAEEITPLVADALSGAGFMTGTGGALVLRIRSTVKTTDSAYGLSGSQWKLDLTFADGTVNAVSLVLQGKSNGSNADKAREKLIADVRSQLEAKFIPELIGRLVKTLE